MKPIARSPSLLTGLAQFADVLQHSEVTGLTGQPLELEAGLQKVIRLLEQCRSKRATFYIIGNGGSAAIASHVVNDLVNGAKCAATTIHDASVLTCMANDHGYDHAYERILAQLAHPGDVLIAISSSGRSVNMLNAAMQMRANGGSVITLTGFGHDNPLRLMGDFNIWLDSSAYGVVEVGHQFVLHYVSDRLCASAVKDVAKAPVKNVSKPIVRSKAMAT
jgi:D-sedoheptulose 7-phosphate isomerase